MQPYTFENGRKVLKQNLTVATIIPVMFTLIIIAFVPVIAVSLPEAISGTTMAQIIVALCILGALITLRSTRSVRKDLASGNIREEKVVAKKVVLHETDYEPGSGVLYMPILATIFPKRYGQQMRAVKTSYIVTENNIKYDISNETAPDKKTFTLCFSEKSEIYLGYL